MLYSFQFSNEELQKIPLLVCLLGENYRQEPVIRSNGMPYYQWLYVKKGQGEFVENGIRHIVNEGQTFFIPPDIPHSYRQMSEEWIIHVIGFTGVLCGQLMDTIKMKDSGVYLVKDRELFPRSIHRMISLKERCDEDVQRYLSKEGYSFLMDMAVNVQIMEKGIPDQKYSVINKIMEYLEENFRQDLSLDMLSEHVSLSKDYLCALFRKKTNYTIMQYLNIIRIGWARIYLEQYPEKNVEEIGLMCGFRSPSYFGKIFKRVVGTTPAGYRKRSSIIFSSDDGDAGKENYKYEKEEQS